MDTGRKSRKTWYNNTDYVMVKEENLKKALGILSEAGYRVTE